MSQVHAPYETTTADAPTKPNDASQITPPVETADSVLATPPAQQVQTPPADTTPPPATNDTPPIDADIADKALAEKGLNMTTFSDEFTKNGELSDKSYKALEKAGIPKSMVDTYIAGIQSLQNGIVSEIHNSVGGADNYNSMMSWAKDNLSQGEIEAFNSMVTSSNKTTAQFAVAGLYAKFSKAEGSNPKLVGGSASGSTQTKDAFASPTDMVDAMRDKRYGKDREYTRMVENKVINSKFM